MLAGCAASEPTPGYLVQLGSSSSWRCGGYAIDERHIVTANHCGLLMLAQTSDGIEVGVRRVAMWPEIDTALYETAVAMRLDGYALLNAMAPGEPGYAFGYCPTWQSAAGRYAQFVSTETEPMQCHELQILMAWTCNGDSGGIVEQNGAVVAMISQFRGHYLALDNGTRIAYATCAVPGEAIAERVEEWRGKQ